MELVRGKKPGMALKIVVYGPEGIGKSTFASRFPRAVFEDTDGSTDHMDVTRAPKAQSWMELLAHVRYFIAHPEELSAYILDTGDWAELLCVKHVCALKQVQGVEDIPYGKGWVYAAEEFGKLLNLLEELKERGVHVVVNCHAQMRKFEQPDELGQYDRWELKLSRKDAPLIKEWADMILFANYQTTVVNVDGQGAAKGKNKVQGGKRVMYTSHHPCWDAKNRFGLPEELPFDFAEIAHLVKPREGYVELPIPVPPAEETPAAAAEEAPASTPAPRADIPPALAALMSANAVQPAEIQAVVAQRGYYPADTPISHYDPAFVSGVLVAAWPKVESMIMQNRTNVPF